MSEIKLFQVSEEGVKAIKTSPIPLQKSLQNLIEKNLEPLLGICFLASEYSTGKVHGGRIDTLGIDKNGSPVVTVTSSAMTIRVSKSSQDRVAPFMPLTILTSSSRRSANGMNSPPS
jgi:hypothetical protein